MQEFNLDPVDRPQDRREIVSKGYAELTERLGNTTLPYTPAVHLSVANRPVTVHIFECEGQYFLRNRSASSYDHFKNEVSINKNPPRVNVIGTVQLEWHENDCVTFTAESDSDTNVRAAASVIKKFCAPAVLEYESGVKNRTSRNHGIINPLRHSKPQSQRIPRPEFIAQLEKRLEQNPYIHDKRIIEPHIARYAVDRLNALRMPVAGQEFLLDLIGSPWTRSWSHAKSILRTFVDAGRATPELWTEARSLFETRMTSGMYWRPADITESIRLCVDIVRSHLHEDAKTQVATIPVNAAEQLHRRIKPLLKYADLLTPAQQECAVALATGRAERGEVEPLLVNKGDVFVIALSAELALIENPLVVGELTSLGFQSMLQMSVADINIRKRLPAIREDIREFVQAINTIYDPYRMYEAVIAEDAQPFLIHGIKTRDPLLGCYGRAMAYEIAQTSASEDPTQPIQLSKLLLEFFREEPWKLEAFTERFEYSMANRWPLFPLADHIRNWNFGNGGVPEYRRATEMLARLGLRPEFAFEYLDPFDDEAHFGRFARQLQDELRTTTASNFAVGVFVYNAIRGAHGTAEGKEEALQAFVNAAKLNSGDVHSLYAVTSPILDISADVLGKSLAAVVEQYSALDLKPRQLARNIHWNAGQEAFRLTVMHRKSPHVAAAEKYLKEYYRIDIPPYPEKDKNVEGSDLMRAIREMRWVCRRALDAHYRFDAHFNDSRRAPGETHPRLALFGADKASKVEYLNCSSHLDFPGKGIAIKGICVDQFVATGTNWDQAAAILKARIPWLFSNCPNLLEHFEFTQFPFTRGACFVVPPASADFELDSTQYSYGVVNEHFGNPFRFGGFGMPVADLSNLLRGAFVPFERGFGFSPDHVDLSSSFPAPHRMPLSCDHGAFLNLTRATVAGGLANAYAAKKDPHFAWEVQRRKETTDLDGHIHKTHILGGYRYLYTDDLIEAVTPLRELHTRVYQVMERLQNLMDCFRLFYSLYKKGQRFDEVNIVQHESAPILHDLYKWHREGKRENCHVLAACSTFQYNAALGEHFLVDSFNRAIYMPDGVAVHLPPDYDPKNPRGPRVWDDFVLPYCSSFQDDLRWFGFSDVRVQTLLKKWGHL